MKRLSLTLQLSLVLAVSAVPAAAVTSISTRSITVQSSQESVELAEANRLSNQALKLYEEQRYKEALDPAKRALEILERILPAADKRVLDSMGNLAVIHFKSNNFKEAESLHKRILAIQEKNLGPESLEVAKTLDALASFHYGRGDKGQAEADLKRALAIREKAAPDSEEVASTLFKLAQMYQFHDDLKKAEQLYERILSFDKKTLPESSEVLIESVDAYACLLRKLKKIDEAKELEARIEGRIRRTTRPLPLDAGILNGRALKLPKPPYPVEARHGRISGVVVVRVTISEEGHVLHACAESGNRVFWHGCERAAYGAEFAPTTVNGKAVRVTGVITYNFTTF